MFPELKQDRARLREILLEKSVRFGDFQLVSGERSDVYVDCKPTTCSAEAMPLVGRLFLGKMRERGWAPQAVGGLMVGAEPIAFATARESLDFGQHIDAFIIRKERKSHGTQKVVEGLAATEGLPAVIVEDVCTKGGSTALAIEHALSAGMQVLGAICLVDREQGGSDLLSARFGCALESIFKLSELRSQSDED